jgi:hypothetical protein
MDSCVMCKRKVQLAENWIKCHLWGGFAIFHWRCFGEYLGTHTRRLVLPRRVLSDERVSIY